MGACGAQSRLIAQQAEDDRRNKPRRMLVGSVHPEQPGPGEADARAIGELSQLLREGQFCLGVRAGWAGMALGLDADAFAPVVFGTRSRRYDALATSGDEGFGQM